MADITSATSAGSSAGNGAVVGVVVVVVVVALLVVMVICPPDGGATRQRYDSPGRCPTGPSYRTQRQRQATRALSAAD
jgi:hypothetical protein